MCGACGAAYLYALAGALLYRSGIGLLHLHHQEKIPPVRRRHDQPSAEQQTSPDPSLYLSVTSNTDAADGHRPSLSSSLYD